MARRRRACAAHVECPDSSACLPDGSCAAIDRVAYVQPGGSGNACTRAMPCGTLDDAIRAGKPFVKIAAGTVIDNNTTSIDGETLTILADPGARLNRSNDGVILEVKNNADVQIYDLEITGGTGASNPAISVPAGGTPRLALTRVTIDGNQGIGLSSSAGGTLNILQSTIRGNQGGGILVSGGEFDITNSFIVSNGGSGSVFGGIKVDAIGASASGVHRIDFNTIAMNTIARSTVVVNLLDETGAPRMIWTLNNAFPTKLTGTDLKSDGNEVAVESIEIAYETMAVSIQ